MGGIFVAVSLRRENVVDVVVNGLKRLEYRGFNGSGLALLTDKGIEVYKDALRIDKVYEKYGLMNKFSHVVLGHTRYATHGKPHVVNTQPHTDCNKGIAVAGDGAIAGYEALRDEVLIKGHNLVSKCDFEVLAHAVEDVAKSDLDPITAYTDVFSNMDGYYSVAILNERSRHVALYCHGPPLYLGMSESLIVASSGLAAMHGFAEKFVKLEQGEVVVIDFDSGNVKTSAHGIGISSRLTPLVVDARYIDRDGYQHHMLREIYEIPQALLRTLYSVQHRYLSMAAKLVADADKLFIIGNGSSLHAGYIASYYLSEVAGLSPVVVSAAEFPLYHADVVGPGTVVIAISQSGESGDVLSSVYEAKLRGASILGLTNFIGSRLSNMSNIYLPIGAGPEMAVPATKTFTSTLLLLYMLTLCVGRQLGKVQESDYRLAIDSVKRLSLDLQERMNAMEHFAEGAAKALAQCRSGYVVSRGITYPLALEGALKFKEVAYVHAEGVEAGEYRHGPQALLDEGFFVLFVMPVEKAALEATYSLVDVALERKATVVAIGFEHDRKLSTSDERVVKVLTPSTSRHLAPIALAVSLYLVSYKLGVALSRQIDTPRYLSKTVQ